MRRSASKVEVADLIERFLVNRLAYPQEWNDFIGCTQNDPAVEVYRKKCYDLDPLVNGPDPVERDAIGELRLISEELRASG